MVKYGIFNTYPSKLRLMNNIDPFSFHLAIKIRRLEMFLTFLVVPLSSHLLDDVEVEDGVAPAARAAQPRQEVLHHQLVLPLARAGQTGQVLQDQLLPVLSKPLQPSSATAIRHFTIMISLALSSCL